MNDIKEKDDGRRTIQPVCSICGDENIVSLKLEMPGVRKDDIEVGIDDDRLIVRGKVAENPAAGTWLLRERPQGNYVRSFTIDDTIDRERIDAEYEQGIMTITLHLKEEIKPRRIEITGK